MQEKNDYGNTEYLTEAISGWKGFGKYNKNREFDTFNDKLLEIFYPNRSEEEKSLPWTDTLNRSSVKEH